MQHPQLCLQHGALVLLLLLLAFATALACHHLHPCDVTFPGTAPNPPQPSHHQHVPFVFDILFHINHPQQAVATAPHILQHLLYILSSPSTPQHWDTQAWQDLLNNLQHYIHHLEQCMTANGMLFEGQGPHNLPFSINKYFRLIQDFICTHNNSTCLWDHVQLKACICFERVDTLMWQMKSQPAPVPHQAHLHQMPISSQHQQPQIEWRQQQQGLGFLSTAHTFSSQEPVPTGKQA
ncbi:interferon-like [Sylvia atricapilla]|uniref:interferon-like n=1 Tax=Sylvia atricapilla TaxID=48155 RepID=UPI003396A52D